MIVPAIAVETFPAGLAPALDGRGVPLALRSPGFGAGPIAARCGDIRPVAGIFHGHHYRAFPALSFVSSDAPPPTANGSKAYPVTR